MLLYFVAAFRVVSMADVDPMVFFDPTTAADSTAGAGPMVVVV